jgi:integrase
VKRVGLPQATRYSLRHGYGTLLIAQGGRQRFVADQVGHRDPGFTMRIDVHSAKRTAHVAMVRLGAAMPRANVVLTEQARTP